MSLDHSLPMPAPQKIVDPTGKIAQIVEGVIRQRMPWAASPISIMHVVSVSGGTALCKRPNDLAHTGYPMSIVEPGWVPVVNDRVLVLNTPEGGFILGPVANAPKLALSSLDTTGAATNSPIVFNGTTYVNEPLPLAGIAQGGASTGQLAEWNGSAWAPLSQSALAIALSQISQSGASTGNLAEWNGSAWVPLAQSALAIDLSQLNQDGATTGQVPAWSGSAWAAAGGMTLLARVLGTGASADMTTAALSQSYTDLLIVWSGRSSAAALSDDVAIRINGDTTASYSGERVVYAGTGTTPVVTESLTVGNAKIATTAGSTAGAAHGGQGEIRVNGYAKTTTHKRWTSVFGFAENVSTGGMFTGHGFGTHSSNSVALTSVTLHLTTGLWDSDSIMSVYGLS